MDPEMYYTLHLRRGQPVVTERVTLEEAVTRLQQTATRAWLVGIYHPASNRAWLPDIPDSPDEQGLRQRWLTEYFDIDGEPLWQESFSPQPPQP